MQNLVCGDKSAEDFAEKKVQAFNHDAEFDADACDHLEVALREVDARTCSLAARRRLGHGRVVNCKLHVANQQLRHLQRIGFFLKQRRRRRTKEKSSNNKREKGKEEHTEESEKGKKSIKGRNVVNENGTPTSVFDTHETTHRHTDIYDYNI